MSAAFYQSFLALVDWNEDLHNAMPKVGVPCNAAAWIGVPGNAAAKAGAPGNAIPTNLKSCLKKPATPRRKTRVQWGIQAWKKCKGMGVRNVKLKRSPKSTRY